MLVDKKHRQGENSLNIPFFSSIFLQYHIPNALSSTCLSSWFVSFLTTINLSRSIDRLYFSPIDMSCGVFRRAVSTFIETISVSLEWKHGNFLSCPWTIEYQSIVFSFTRLSRSITNRPTDQCPQILRTYCQNLFFNLPTCTQHTRQSNGRYWTFMWNKRFSIVLRSTTLWDEHVRFSNE